MTAFWRFSRAVSAMLATSWLFVFCFSLCGADTPGASSEATTLYLECKPAGADLGRIGFADIRSSVPPASVSKAPNAGAPGLLYGELRIDTNRWLLAWHKPDGRLFVDLNRNGDFTDDAGGSFASDGANRRRFTNIVVRAPVGGVMLPLSVDIDLARSNGRENVTLRSWFAAKVEVNGRAWQVGFVPRIGPWRRFGYQSPLLVVRPWEKREESFGMFDEQPGFWRFRANQFEKKVFLQDAAFQLNLTPSSEKPNAPFRVELIPQQPKLGEIAITGRFIELLSLEKDSDYAVLLHNPAPTVWIPAMTYSKVSVRLQHGADTATSVSDKIVSVKEKAQAQFAVGGPLKNLVTTRRSGGNLHLDYSLVGVGGEGYTLAAQDRLKPPKFAIYKDNRRLATGKFEFG
jgi:hypothetical protein